MTTGRFANSTTVTRAELINSGRIVNRPPVWRRWQVIDSPLSADQLDRLGFHAAAHARRSGEHVEYFESGFTQQP